jgi:hypothetical protein
MLDPEELAAKIAAGQNGGEAPGAPTIGPPPVVQPQEVSGGNGNG